jgi:hypothetical protein
MPEQLASSYYGLLGLTSSASTQQIRRSYRELSKLYHPDTTALPAAIATAKFQQLNEAYATLSSPERRLAYDLKLGYSRLPIIQPAAELNRSSAGLDPTDRSLSGGELFALFILGITFVACLMLVVTIGLTRGDVTFHFLTPVRAIETVPSPLELPQTPEAVTEVTESSAPEEATTEPIKIQESEVIKIQESIDLPPLDLRLPAAEPTSSQLADDDT